ncbi:MarR family transcriptional regulator [Verrucomicrobia bacterium LW23]|nr:MarR family transcriptional regulator [Verrucomicrobia bacterium LW23]
METFDDNIHLAEELAEIVTQLQRSFLVELSTEVNKGNISIPQYTLLGFLNQSSGLNMSQLADLMRHTTPATTGLVDRLVDSGLVERFSHPKDRRQVLVRITDRGRELVEGMKRGIVRNILDLFNDLSHEDQEAWVRIYRTIIKRTTAQHNARVAASSSSSPR